MSKRSGLAANFGFGIRMVCEHISIVVVGLTLAVSTGCSSKQCLFQSDCAEGLVCAESVCRQACDEMRQCPVDFICESGACYLDETTICADGDVCEADGGPPMQVDMNMMTTQLDMMLGSDGGVQNDPMSDMSVPIDASLPIDAAIVDAAVNPLIDAGAPQDSRFNLTGPYMVVHTLVFANGGDVSEAQEVRNKIDLTAISNNRYRMEVRDEYGRNVLYVDSAVNFAHRDGVGFYNFQYPWNLETEDECTYVEVRSQNGRYTQGPLGYTLRGLENREVCTCMAEPVNARVPVIDQDLCTGTYYRQQFEVEWIPW